MKHTDYFGEYEDYEIEDIIENCVKHTEDGDWLDGDERIGDIVENGVKETYEIKYQFIERVEDTVQNGIKEK